jgi:hypothetical protein
MYHLFLRLATAVYLSRRGSSRQDVMARITMVGPTYALFKTRCPLTARSVVAGKLISGCLPEFQRRHILFHAGNLTSRGQDQRREGELLGIMDCFCQCGTITDQVHRTPF